MRLPGLEPAALKSEDQVFVYRYIQVCCASNRQNAVQICTSLYTPHTFC